MSFLFTLNLTSVFSSSLMLALRIIAVLFCWHVQHRSVIGRATITWGRNFFQIAQKHEYDTALKERVAAVCWYSLHTAAFVVVDGRSCMSSLLYPGIRPGRRMAFISVYSRMKLTIFLMSSRTIALGAMRPLCPWTRGISPFVR